MTRHVLDRPVWSALSGRQVAFSIGNDRARRFAKDVGPFAGARDDGAESLAALADLVGPEDELLLLQADPIVLPPVLVAATTAVGVQLVAAQPPPTAADGRIERLTPSDVDAMIALATLTRPGPFAARTAELGAFWGVKEGGRLVAMAGERMQHDGFAEVSGVCTHPDARGRGLARALSLAVMAQVAARGQTPYLHAYATNTGAIGLYESIGFRLRRHVHVAVVRRRAATSPSEG